MIKRVFLILLIVAFLPVSTAIAAEEITFVPYDNTVKLLNSLGILDDTYVALNGESVPISDGIVNRAIYQMTGMNVGDTESYADISIGITAGKLMHAWGYQAILNPSETTELEYYAKAFKAGFLKGVSGGASAKLTSKNFVKMLENALYIEYMSGIFVDGKARYETDGRTYMSTHKITKRHGIVEGTVETSINHPDGTNKNYVTIGGASYVTLMDVTPYLGYSVDFYTKESDVYAYDELVCIYDNGKNKELIIPAEDIEGVASNKITYEKTEDKTAEITISDQYILIYNGKYKLRKSDALLQPAMGNVRFLDNNGDNKYDIVFVTSYEVYVVNHVSDDVIYDQNNKTPLDLSDETKVRKIIKNGEATTVKRLIKDNIVYAAVNPDTGFIEINASDITVQGTVEAIEDYNSSYRYYTINGEQYLAAVSLPVNNVLGCDGVFYLGPTGRIEHQKITYQGNYGILVGVMTRQKLDSGYKVKIFTENNEFKEYEIDDKAVLYDDAANTIDYTQMVKLENYSNVKGIAGKAAPIIKYTLQNETIKTISLPVVNDGNIGSKRDRYCFQAATPDATMVTEQSYNIYSQPDGSINPWQNAGTNDNAYKFLSASTIIFEIRYDDQRAITSDYEDYLRAYKGNKRTFDNNLYGTFYDLTDERDVSVMSFYTRGMTTSTNYSNAFLIQSVSTAVDADGETKLKLSGYSSGKYVSYFVSDDVEISTAKMTDMLGSTPRITVNELRKGDYIIALRNYKGEVVHIETLVLSSYRNDEYTTFHSSAHHDMDGEMMFGEVIHVGNRIITLRFDRNLFDSDCLEFPLANYKSVAKTFYDSQKDTVLESGDICVGDYVYVRRNSARLVDIFVRK